MVKGQGHCEEDKWDEYEMITFYIQKVNSYMSKE